MLQTALLSGSPILDVDASLLVYLAVFGILFFLLRALVFRPMMDLFDERERATVGAREEARRLERESEAKVASFEAQLAKVRIEATSERDRLRAEGSRLDRSLNEKVRKETDEMVADAEAEMAREAEKVRSHVAEAAPGLAREIAHKLLGREVGK